MEAVAFIRDLVDIHIMQKNDRLCIRKTKGRLPPHLVLYLVKYSYRMWHQINSETEGLGINPSRFVLLGTDLHLIGQTMPNGKRSGGLMERVTDYPRLACLQR